MCRITLGRIRYVEHNFRENLDQPTGGSRRGGRRREEGGGRREEEGGRCSTYCVLSVKVARSLISRRRDERGWHFDRFFAIT